MLLPITLTTSAMLAFWSLALVAGAGVVGAPTALVFPPDYTARQSLEAASQLDAAIVAIGSRPFIIVIIPRSPLTQTEMRDAGALFAAGGGGSIFCATES
ncbi:MAG: hypothetical protein AAFN79_01385 [Pseudomonadota bacterium]